MSVVGLAYDVPMSDASDPFEHFGEQEISWSAVEKYREHLVARVRHFFAQHPEMSMGGLVLCAGSALCKAFAEAEPPERRPPPDRDCVTAMPRPDFEAFIKRFAPKHQDQLPEADPEWRRSGRTLPVLIITENGSRLACLDYDIDGGA